MPLDEARRERLRLGRRAVVHDELAPRAPVVEPLGPDQFAGPGVAHVGYGEYNQRHLLHRWADYLESEYEGVDFRALSIGGEPPLDVEPRPAGITNNGQKVVR